MTTVEIKPDVCGKLLGVKSSILTNEGKSVAYSDLIDVIILAAERLARKNGFKDLDEAILDLKKQGVNKKEK